MDASEGGGVWGGGHVGVNLPVDDKLEVVKFAHCRGLWTNRLLLGKKNTF